MQMQIRQGDILFVRVEEELEGEQVEDGVVAQGEATGHHHRVSWDDLKAGSAEVLRDGPRGDLALVVKKPSRVTHQEHDTVMLSEGNWKVVRQRELSAGEVRHVLD